MAAPTMDLKVIDHQNVHLYGQRGKTQWGKEVTRALLDPLLMNIVRNKEQELRKIFNEINDSKLENTMIRTFYITHLFSKKDRGAYCDNSNDGVCIEVAISSEPGNNILTAEIHGYPANIKKVGIDTAINRLITSR